ncbi:MAG TPA: DUF2069 domain-containing protein [Dokdonella sp.]|jgi:uncharacterized membrane protein|uniref:DUF2069 domain-containing protein n=1 Tax=Dokdonella sp. TaxID=2291710 RepID=UPI002BD26941|nr:DUF2069 domain-containing protein [Dokdonella sp.]HNV08674.1 DUF2069 domain-containing protein [Dokdonella sp.]HPW04160.1 DUF2069 domain-containing protein [Dokdonella sp.]
MSAVRVALLAWFGLFVLHVIWHAWLAPPENGQIGLALAFTVLPLLLPLLAWRAGLGRMLLWLGILGLFYFCHGVVAAWGIPRIRLLALIEVGLCLFLVGSLGWISRSSKN